MRVLDAFAVFVFAVCVGGPLLLWIIEVIDVRLTRWRERRQVNRLHSQHNGKSYENSRLLPGKLRARK